MPWPLAFQQQVIEALTEKVGPVPRPCVVCDHTEWELANGFGSLSLSDDPKTVALGGRIIPAVVLVCRHCGNLQMLNAIILGITPPEEPDEPDESPNGGDES